MSSIINNNGAGLSRDQIIRRGMEYANDYADIDVINNDNSVDANRGIEHFNSVVNYLINKRDWYFIHIIRTHEYRTIHPVSMQGTVAIYGMTSHNTGIPLNNNFKDPKYYEHNSECEKCHNQGVYMLASDNIRLYPGYFIEAVARGIASKQVDTATQIITIRERYKNEFITAYSEAAILDQKLKSKNCCRSHGRARMFYR